MLTLVSLPGASAQSGATPEAGDSASLLTGSGITSRVLGSSNAATLAITKPHLVFQRITFGQNVKLPARATISPEVIYVESGAVSIEDSFGFATETGAGQTLTFNPDVTYELANTGSQDAVVYRLSISGTSSSSASPVAGAAAATPVSGMMETVILIDREVQDLPTGDSTLFIADATFAPGSKSGKYAHSGPLGIYVQSGTLSVLSPSGVTGQLKENAGVVLPTSAPFVASNPSDSDASILLVGVAGTDAPILAEVTPVPTPTIEPTATIAPSQTPVPTPTTEPSPTPEPTNTPVPTPTTEPSPTPLPTNTPEPTPSPTPDAEIQGLQNTFDGYIAAEKACNTEGMLLYVADFVIWSQDQDEGPSVSPSTIYGVDDLGASLRKSCTGGGNYSYFSDSKVTDISHVGSVGTIAYTWVEEQGWTDDTGRFRCQVWEGSNNWKLEQQVDGRWLITDRSNSAQKVRRSCQHLTGVTQTDKTVSASSHGAPSAATSGESVDIQAMLPTVNDIPDGLSELGRSSRSLQEATAKYPDPADALAQFTAWGWQANAICNFGPVPISAWEEGKLNGVYVSIHQFDSPDHAASALDYSLIAQATGTPLQEIATQNYGDYTRALYGLLDYGNEITFLVQKGNLFVRVSAASVGADPTPKAEAILQTILAKA